MKTLTITTTLKNNIEDEQGNSYKSLYIKIGIQGIETSSSEEEDYIGWFAIPFKDISSYTSGKSPVRILNLNPSVDKYNPGRQLLPTFGAKVSSKEFTYEVKHDNSNKLNLTEDSMISLLDNKIKPSIKLINIGTKENPILPFKDCKFS
jgi:hypothetical protein